MNIFIATVLVFASMAAAQPDDGCYRITNFNAGLLPTIPHYKERSSQIPAAILQEQADVVCFQEYWFENDLRALINGIGDQYPYHYSLLHDDIGTLSSGSEQPPRSACTTEDLEYFNSTILPCISDNGCIDIFRRDQHAGNECVITNCRDKLNSDTLDDVCITCFILTQALLRRDVSACHRDEGEDNRFNAPGLAIFSKKPINNAEFKSFFPGTHLSIQRGYLDVDVEDVGKVFCTHFTAVANFVYGEYNTSFSSYAEQQTHELAILRADVERAGPHILSGDLNTGPKISSTDPEKSLTGEMPQTYHSIIDWGYKSYYFQQDGRCTHCGASANNVIDHILQWGEVYQVTQRRTLDRTVPFQYSDHFGVRADICPILMDAVGV